MHISVIIAAYNVAPFLGDAIASVMLQTCPDWSLIVVDDGSSDDTALVAARFADPRITVLRQANAGVSAARNRGMAASNGDAILFLDGDDWLALSALARLADALDKAPGAVAASGAYARVASDGALRRFGPPPAGDLLRRLLVRNLFANGGHVLIRRHAAEAAGCFHTGLSYGEDWEYWTRLAAAGNFASAPRRDPLLFVRERPGSAYLRMATDPAWFEPCLNAIFANTAVTARFSAAERIALRQRMTAENAWIIGRELIRHGRHSEGRRWLLRALRRAPSLKRVALTGLSFARTGPFTPYQTTVGR